MRFTEITVISTTLEVTVFQKILRIFRASCSQVHCHHHITACFSGPVHKFIQTKLVCLDHAPGKLRSGRTLIFWSNAVLPAESGYKISARITDDGYLKFSYQFQSILTESLLVRNRTAFLINALINRTSKMFNKGAEDPFVCFSGEKIFVHDDLCFFHCKNPPVIEFCYSHSLFRHFSPDSIHPKDTYLILLYIQKTAALSIILSFLPAYVIAFLRKRPDFSKNFLFSLYSAALHFS